MMINIATQNSQAASNAAGSLDLSNVTETSKTNSSEFGLLIAKLLGLAEPTQVAPVQGGQVEQKENANLPLLGDAQAQELTNAPNDKTIIDAISDLMKAMEQIQGSLNDAKPINQQTIETAMASINTLIAKLQAIAPPPAGATTSMLVAQMQGQGANPLANGQNNNQEIAKNILSQSQPFQEVLKGLSNTQTISSLNQVAKKLAQPVNGTTEQLGQKLQQLAQKLAEIAPANTKNIDASLTNLSNANNAIKGANNSAMNMNADATINNEVAKSITALLGNKNMSNIESTQASSPKLDASQLAYLNGQKPQPTTNVGSFANEQNKPSLTTTPMQTNVNSTPTVMAAASLTSAQTAPIKIDITAQADPLLINQGINNTNFNAQISALKPATALYQGPQQNLNLPHVAYEFARNVQNGLSRFQIRLDPPEMGRIDVKMEIDKTGALNARLSVERADTLDLLQRDVRALERALAQAGLDTNKTNLEFSLKGNPFEREDNFFSQGEEAFLDDLGDENEQSTKDIISQIPSTIIYHGIASAGGLNITA